jgi:DDE family transposase
MQHADLETQLHAPALFGPSDEPTAYRLSPAERLARLHTTVLAARSCAQWVRTQLDPLASEAQPRVTVWLERLDQIVADEVEITTPSSEGAVRVTPWPEAKKGSYRLGSATDPEATYRVPGAGKTDFGYNVQVAVTDNFVREIQVEPGAQPDGVAIPAVLCAEKDFQDLVPPKFIYDTAAGEGKTRARVAAATHGQTQLVAPLPPKNQPPTPFPPEQFTLSVEGRTLTCPGGQTTDIAYGSSSAEGRNFRFLGSQCADGPLWAQCRKDQPGAKTRRRVFISDYRQEIDAARAYNQTAEYQADLQQRPRVERIIAALVRYNGARRARRRGLANADFQAKMNATSYNLKKCGSP